MLSSPGTGVERCQVRRTRVPRPEPVRAALPSADPARSTTGSGSREAIRRAMLRGVPATSGAFEQRGTGERVELAQVEDVPGAPGDEDVEGRGGDGPGGQQQVGVLDAEGLGAHRRTGALG